MTPKWNQSGFKVVSLAAAALFFWLFYQLLVTPASICEDFGIERNEAVFIIERRASVLMLAFAVLLTLARNTPPSAVRRSIAAAVALCFTGLAILGGYEVLRGSMKPSVWGIVAVEVAFALAFLAAGVLDLTTHSRPNPVA